MLRTFKKYFNRKYLFGIFILVALVIIIEEIFFTFEDKPTSNLNPLDVKGPTKDHSANQIISKEKNNLNIRRLFRNFTAGEVRDGITVGEVGCTKWIVSEAEHIPMKAVAVFRFLVEKENSEWCCVTLLKDKVSEAEYGVIKSNRFFVFDLEEQKRWYKDRLEKISVQTPVTLNFGKNFGYIFAIEHGAKEIYDTNELSILDKPSIPSFQDTAEYVFISKENHLLTSYENFISKAPAGIWNHGFYNPLVSKVEDYYYWKPKDHSCVDSNREEVRVMKVVPRDVSLLDNKDLAERKIQLGLHKGTFATYDSSSVLNEYSAFFGLFLQQSLDIQIAETLRSLFAQRLLCDIGYSLAFVDGLKEEVKDVTMSNDGEGDVKMRKGLVEFLLHWQSNAATLVERMEELAVEFYERGYWGETEVSNAQIWIMILLDVGYEFPKINGDKHCTYINSSEIENCLSEKKPSGEKLDLYLRMTAISPLVEFYEHIFVWTLKFFWQKENPVHLILVLDDEKVEDHNFGETKKDSYPHPSVYYEIDKNFYRSSAKNRMQWSMHWADNYATRDYVGFVDTDSMFNTLINEDMLFDGDKPHVHGYYGASFNEWGHAAPPIKQATYDFLKVKHVIHAMNYFPVIIKTKHLAGLREYIENVHGISFDQVFLTLSGPIFQFNIMMNYVWYFHRDEYVWHMEESQNGDLFDPDHELTEFPEITEEMRIPFPKFLTHFKYFRYSVNVAEGWVPFTYQEKNLKTRDKLMLEGYCFSGGFLTTPETCKDFNETGLRPTLFDFEFHSWLWDDRCLTSQQDHYARTKGLSHEWDMSMLN